jgi:hypothetical protein
MLICPMYEALDSLASPSASVSQKGTMIPWPAFGSVSICRPLKPRCSFKTGAKPSATLVTSAFMFGGNRMFVTLAYTILLPLPRLTGLSKEIVPKSGSLYTTHVAF